MHDRAWIHLNAVYLILYQFQCVYPSHPMFNGDFVSKLFALFGTPDADERQELVQFFRSYIPKHLHQQDLIIGKLLAIIRSHIQVSHKPFQMTVALPVLVAVFELSDPKPRFYEIIQKDVLPLLHDPFLEFLQAHIAHFLEYYTHCHPENVVVIVREILKNWPKTSVPKMCVLMILLFEYVPRLTGLKLTEHLPKFLRIVAESCNSSAVKVSEVAFSFFLTKEFDDLMLHHSEIMVDGLVPGVSQCQQEHWEPTIRERAGLCLAIMEKLDRRSFAIVIKKLTSTKNTGKHRAGWTEIIGLCDGMVDVSGKSQEIERLFPREV
jgi:hypothetical protein